MTEKKYRVYLTESEQSSLIKALVNLKNTLIKNGKYTDAVDELIIKVTKARKKKLKVI
ncbi:MAG: hypothetical protein IJ903_03920 [Ruminococcus sp.]|nr:hypothetical protein [Ruminococcus sp.]